MMDDEGRIMRHLADALEAGPEAYAPKNVRLAGYEEPAAGVNQVGALMGEVIVAEYESVIKVVEGMVRELDSFESYLLGQLADVKKSRDEVAGLAEHFRERAQADFKEVQNKSQVLDELRQTCNEMKKKLAATTG